MSKRKPQHQPLISAEVEPPSKRFACCSCWRKLPEEQLTVIEIARRVREFRCAECLEKSET